MDSPLAMLVLAMIERPGDGLEGSATLVLNSGTVIEGQPEDLGIAGVEAGEEVFEGKASQGQAEVLGRPGAGAKEIGEVAGIGGVEVLAGPFGEGFAVRCGEQGVGDAEQMVSLRERAGDGEQGQKADELRGRSYKGLHGAASGARAEQVQARLF
jgi:hypothetical protein